MPDTLQLNGLTGDDFLNLCLSGGDSVGQIVRPIRTVTRAELRAALRAWLAAEPSEPSPGPPPLELPPIFAQRDPRWRDLPYTAQSDKTFAEAGCYVCALTALVSWAGYAVDPLEIAAALDTRGAFTGAELLRPEVLTDAYPQLGDYQRHDWRGPADLGVLQKLLAHAPVVVQIDFQATTALEPHFVLAYKYIPDSHGGRNDSVLVMDPWDGAYLNAAADTQTNTYGKRTGGGYFWPEWWERADMAGTQKTRVERLLWGARYFEVVR